MRGRPTTSSSGAASRPASIAPRRSSSGAARPCSGAPLEEARLHNLRGAGAAGVVFSAPALGRLSRLVLDDGFGVPELRLLAHRPGAADLRALFLNLGEVGPEAAQALADTPHLAGLRELTLHGWPQIRDTGLAALATSPHLANLTHRWLNNNEIGGVGIRALTASKWMGLQSLRLPVNNVRPDEAGVLAEWLAGLHPEELDLSRNRELHDAGLRALAGCPGLAALRVLRLIDCGLTDEALQALAGSPHLAEVRYLNLSANSFSDAGLRPLAESHHLRHLRFLSLDGCRFSAAALDALLASERLPSLQFVLTSHRGMETDEWLRLQGRWKMKVFNAGDAWGWQGELGTGTESLENLPEAIT
jgi:hypothetical protein